MWTKSENMSEIESVNSLTVSGRARARKELGVEIRDGEIRLRGANELRRRLTDLGKEKEHQSA